MSLSALESTINSAFDARDGISTATRGEVREAVDHALDLLDKGEARVAVRETSGKWKVHQWLKKAVLLSFRLNDMTAISGGPGKASWWDKVPSKFDGWGENRFRDAGFRAVPGAIVRRSAYIAKNVVLMPSFVNLGAYVDESTMIDTWSTVGSCAQIGKRVHISGGVGIGGVLEPLQAEPVIVEDDCFIGARWRGAGDGGVPRRVDENRRSRYRRDLCRRGPRIRCRGARRAARQTTKERPARARHRLRRDRQARRRAHPRQDQHQRTVTRLKSNRNRPCTTNSRTAVIPPSGGCDGRRPVSVQL